MAFGHRERKRVEGQQPLSTSRFAHGFQPCVIMKEVCVWRGVECPEFVEGQYLTYILLCSDDSYYVGTTDDMRVRLHDHNHEKGAVWTGLRRPVKLVYYETYPTLVVARRRERQIKGWTRLKKEKLIKGEWGKMNKEE